MINFDLSSIVIKVATGSLSHSYVFYKYFYIEVALACELNYAYEK